MDKQLLELYSDYLISSCSQTSATGVSQLLDEAISHDQITGFLSGGDYGSRELWQLVKAVVRPVENEDGVLIIDDTIQEKPSTDEHESITWPFDPSNHRTVKGVHIVNGLDQVPEVSIPVAFESVVKDCWSGDLTTGTVRRKGELTKHDLLRAMLQVCQQNQLRYRSVLSDNWFASAEHMNDGNQQLKKDFVLALKSNRPGAVSLEDRQQGRFVRVDTQARALGVTQLVYLKGVACPVVLTKPVFKNQDSSEGVLYLVSSDVTLDDEALTTPYQNRWGVEVFHKSVQSNAALAQSPTRRVRTQSNHCFAAIYGCFKLECLQLKHQLNHFALRSKLYMQALLASFHELQKLAA